MLIQYWVSVQSGAEYGRATLGVSWATTIWCSPTNEHRTPKKEITRNPQKEIHLKMVGFGFHVGWEQRFAILLSVLGIPLVSWRESLSLGRDD